jgi:hypothetical protein
MEGPIPVIIRDHDCCNLGCPHAVNCKRLPSCAAAILIPVESCTFRVWEEILDSGGLDILPKPFIPRTVLKYLEFAYKQWTMGAPGGD